MREVLSVTELNEYVRAKLQYDELLSSVRIRGEISNLKKHSSGHIYFSLKDDGALIRCVMFRSSAQRLRIVPQDGMRVVLRGGVSLYVKDGQYQFYAEGMERDGVGELYLEFERRKARLAEEGVFDQARKSPLPPFPRKIAVITSPTGAVIRDILRVASRRNSAVSVMLIPSAVQGDSAAEQLARALVCADEREYCDVIILARGGGSLEDLWPFNDEGLARAISACATPVISAVGHETDFTLADFAADVRAGTPSMAAELAVPMREAIAGVIAECAGRAERSLMSRLSVLEQRLGMFSRSTVLSTRHDPFYQQRQRVAMASMRAENAFAARMSGGAQALSLLSARLSALDPKSVMARGYAIIKSNEGVVKSVKPLYAGRDVDIIFLDGEVTARIK